MILTPHTAARVYGYMDKVLDLLADNWQRFLSDQKLKNIIDKKLRLLKNKKDAIAFFFIANYLPSFQSAPTLRRAWFASAPDRRAFQIGKRTSGSVFDCRKLNLHVPKSMLQAVQILDFPRLITICRFDDGQRFLR